MSEFQFKKFTIQLNNEVFKFGTDAALTATLAPLENISSALEIGCGSGVISFMLAQRNPAIHLTGIDINPKAVDRYDSYATD